MNVKLIHLLLFSLLGAIPKSSAKLPADSAGQQTTKVPSSKQELETMLKLHRIQQPKDENYTTDVAKNFDLNYAKKAYFLCADLGMLDTLQALAVDIGYIYELREEYDSAFTYYYKTIDLFEELEKSDRTFSLTQNILYNNNMLYKIIEADKIKQQKQSKKITYLFFTALFLLLLIILSIAYFYKKLKIKNVQISKKNSDLEYYRFQIESSLDYARTIQNSIITNEIIATKTFLDSFVMYKPKNKVGGDFIWTHQCDDFIYIGVADCTGHGVPGALLTIVGNFLLDAIVNHYGQRETDIILNKLHLDIIKTLNKKLNTQRPTDDGMDIALLRVNRKDNTIQFSGANRSVYIIRNNKIIELKGNRRPIGQTVIDFPPFTKEEFQLENNDMVYAFSDGYYDQLGEKTKKRFLRKNFIELLKKNSGLTFEEQKAVLEKTFTVHKGTEVQTDDLLVVGIKVC